LAVGKRKGKAEKKEGEKFFAAEAQRVQRKEERYL
jgi:hypothetical protein